MGFSGGSSNITKAHQHDSAVTQDGGALAANATQFGLTNGSLLFSDGTNIQELGIGSSSEVLGTASGTTPTWQAGAAGGGNYEHVEQFVLNPTSDVFTCTLASALNVSDFREVVAIWQGRWNTSGTNALECQIATNNGLVTAHYSWLANVLTGAATLTTVNALDIDNFTVGNSLVGTPAGSSGNIVMQFTVLPDVTGNGEIFLRWWQTGTNVGQNWGSGHFYESGVASISTINGLTLTNAGGIDFLVDSTVDIYKVTV